MSYVLTISAIFVCPLTSQPFLIWYLKVGRHSWMFPVLPRFCHMIYYHSDKKYPSLRGCLKI